jgi:signal transduction histidine kinase
MPRKGASDMMKLQFPRTRGDPNWLIRRKHFFILAVVASLVVAGGAFLVTWRNSAALGQATSRMMTVSDASSELRIVFGEIVADIGPLMMTGDPTLLDRVDRNSRRFDAALDELGSAIAGDEEAEALFALLRESRAVTLSYEDDFFALLRAGDLGGAARLTQEPEYFEAGMRFGPAFEELLRTALDRARASYAQSEAAQRNALIISAAGFLVVIGLWTSIALDWFRQTRAAHELNEGLEHRVVERTQQLETALVRAEAANEAKSDFLSTMSHELRTPLNGVLGMTGALARSGLSAEQSSMLDVAEESGRSLLALLNDVLDYAMLDSGRVEPRREPLKVADVVNHAIASHLKDARSKSLALGAQIDDTALAAYLGDEARIGQALDVLLSNAVKFTEEGRITVRASHGSDGVKMMVSDSGCGIPDDHLTSIFEPFTQVDASLTRRHGGAGLGLARARKLVALMGGEMGVTSTVKAGSTFWFVLPLERAPSADVREARAA